MKNISGTFKIIAAFIFFQSYMYGMENFRTELNEKAREFGVFRYSPSPNGLGFACLAGNPKDIKTTKLYLGMYWMDSLNGMPVFNVGPIFITNVSYPVTRYRYFMREFNHGKITPAIIDNAKLVEQYQYHVLSTTLLDTQKKEVISIKADDVYLVFSNLNRGYLHYLMTQDPRRPRDRNYWKLLSWMRISVHTTNTSLTRACWTMTNGTTWRWWNLMYQYMKFGPYLQGKQGKFIEE
eukprot:GAHX01001366.1.p1 GENE.GAHX01001366.1~~GAHX01001366.1.p1  ORF type:complete len:237 (-),score=24.15 GAHX01001366.1:32-742(-)